MNTLNYKIFDAHMHTYGIFLDNYDSVLDYMDKYHVEKAIITTINKTKYYSNAKEDTKAVKANNGKKSNDIAKNRFQRFRDSIPKGQLSHDDVIQLHKKAPNRFYKFFWFNPMFKPEKKEENFNILKEHLDNGFIGVKIHSSFNFVKIPRDIIDLVEFMQNYDKNLILFIHSAPKLVFLNGVSTKDVAKLAKNYPSLKIMLGHAAYTMESAVEVGTMLKKFENVFFETSCCVSFGIYNLIKSVGHKRILFGSDSPTASSLPLEIQKIIHMPRITDEMKQDILYNNIVNLLSKKS